VYLQESRSFSDKIGLHGIYRMYIFFKSNEEAKNEKDEKDCQHRDNFFLSYDGREDEDSKLLNVGNMV